MNSLNRSSIWIVIGAAISVALVSDGSVYGGILTVVFLMLLYLGMTAVYKLLSAVTPGRTVKSLPFMLIYFGLLCFTAIHLASFGQYLGSGTLYFGKIPFVVAGSVTLQGYLYSIAISQFFGFVTTFVFWQRIKRDGNSNRQ